MTLNIVFKSTAEAWQFQENFPEFTGPLVSVAGGWQILIHDGEAKAAVAHAHTMQSAAAAFDAEFLTKKGK